MLVNSHQTIPAYYSNLNFSNNQVYFNAQPEAAASFLPNLEINPNLLHSEKEPKTEISEAAAKTLEDQILEEDYADEIPYLSLSKAIFGDSLSIERAPSENTVMFKDNPFIGQRFEDTRSPVNVESSIYGSQSELINSQDLATNMYTPSQTNSMFYDQENMRLPDVSTLKDPRKAFDNRQESTKNEPMYSMHTPTIPMTAQGFAGLLPQSQPLIRNSHQGLPQIIPTGPTKAPKDVDTKPISSHDSSIIDPLVKTQLPPKKRKLTEDEELAIYIQKIKEEKERKKKVEENISYPAQRQMSIADLHKDFPKVKTLAARKLYPEGTAADYYEYPPGYEQYNDYNDYGNKRSIMNVYINGVRECSANYPLCLMIGTMHTCVNNNQTGESNNQYPTETQNQPRTAQEPSAFPDQAFVTQPQPLQNAPEEIIPTSRAKRSRKAPSLEQPPIIPAKRGRGRPRKNPN